MDEPEEGLEGVPLDDGENVTLYDSQEQAEVSRFKGGTEFLLLVDQSLRGLREGAAVEFRGLKIGRVAEISYGLVEDPKIDEMPVLIQLDARLLEKHFPANLINKGAEGFTKAVSRKLRASIRSSSLITGQMFVDLDYFRTWRRMLLRNGENISCCQSSNPASGGWKTRLRPCSIKSTGSTRAARSKPNEDLRAGDLGTGGY